MKDNIKLAFAATEKEWDSIIPKLVETENVKNYVLYGKDNLYPEYLYSLFSDVTTLQTIIEGTADYVTGNDVKCNVSGFNNEINTKGDTMRELVRLCARDFLIYGGFTINVIRNKVGDVRELYYIDFRYIRSSKKNDLFWYSEDFGKKYIRNSKTVVYPKFIPEARDVASSILYVKNNKTTTYPIPRYSGSIKACEIEKKIDTYHLASLENGFAGSYIFNFLNGIPTDEVKREIEKNITEKFCGASNSGRILINFANGADNAAKIEKLEAEDFGEKYESLAKRSKEQIFTAFRAQPILFGMMKENNGFSQDEYLQAFAIYNRTVVKSVADTIIEAIDKIFGIKNSVKITPFSVEVADDTLTDKEVVS